MQIYGPRVLPKSELAFTNPASKRVHNCTTDDIFVIYDCFIPVALVVINSQWKTNLSRAGTHRTGANKNASAHRFLNSSNSQLYHTDPFISSQPSENFKRHTMEDTAGCHISPSCVSITNVFGRGGLKKVFYLRHLILSLRFNENSPFFFLLFVPYWILSGAISNEPWIFILFRRVQEAGVRHKEKI